MLIFASGDLATSTLLTVGLFIFLAYRCYIYTFKPEIWEAQQERKRLEKERKAKARNSALGAVAGGLLKAFLGHRNHH